MTLAEMLVVIAIIGILSGVAFVAVYNHQRSLGQLERDGIAKEIFVAAQNHLTIAYGEGYLGITDFGLEDTYSKDKDKNDIKDDWYFIVNGNIDENSVLGQMLPFGSIDETVRAGGSYIIRYQKNTGLVLDVFYCTRHGSPSQYNHDLSINDYHNIIGLKDTDETNHKDDRRNWETHILGWYGGTNAATLASTSLTLPKITVHNKEMLYVEVSNPNKGNSYALLRLIITGSDSKAKKYYELKSSGADSRVKHNSSGTSFYVILDAVTGEGNVTGMNFGNIEANTTEKFIPGEDITIQAVAYSKSALTKIAYSSKSTVNSLFGSINSTKDTAYISNIRHLENLDKDISHLDQNDGTGPTDKIKISHAEQTDSFSWINFQKEIRKLETGILQDTDTASEDGYESVAVYSYEATKSPTTTGYYKPIQPNYTLTYDGKSRSISDVAVNTSGNAGLFGAVSASTVSSISNLELIDFSITGTGSNSSAGALAGTLNGCTVTNVLARNSAGTSTKAITAKTAGGLVGTTDSGTTVQYSASSVIVKGNAGISFPGNPTVAGGLIGNAGGTITYCYSGGHTSKGSYAEWVKNNTHPCDVTGSTAGGLTGTFSGSKIENSYSTCSVSGTTAGGFAGSAAGTITNCYSTGLVTSLTASTTSTKFAFVATGTPNLSGNYYYRIINEVPSTKDNAQEGETEPMLPVNGYELNTANMAKIKPIDLNAESYNTFTGKWDSWNPARAFDPALVQYYGGSYPLKTVDELNAALPTGYSNWNQLFTVTHYGDWPSPEVFFINQSSGS